MDPQCVSLAMAGMGHGCVEHCINYIDEGIKVILLKAKDDKIIVSCSECHRYGYTYRFHIGLAMSMGTGMRLPTHQNPYLYLYQL